MRKIGSESFFDRHTHREREREQAEKIEKMFKKNQSDQLPRRYPKEEVEEELAPYDPEKRHRQVLIFWRALEYDKKERHPRWYLFFFAILFGLVLYAFLTNNLLMSIIFIIFGFLFYFYEKKEPEEYTFGITQDGVFAQDRLYEFESLDNFWIFYEPGGIKELSLKSQKPFLPYIDIPLGSTDPTKIREILLGYLPEEEHEKGIMDFVEKVL